MKNKRWIITLIIVLIILILGYFFYPLCRFHKIGSDFYINADSTPTLTCHCSILGAVCVSEGKHIDLIEGEYIDLTEDELKYRVDDTFNEDNL
ncbi:MAG TPA: hypothetical protein PLA60_02750 [Candidatus Pacearchaeota archaeon]|jgi:hypothetical protein|nr:hypothetical protein [Candidatus Pacearchaeota archaeon]